MKLFCSGMLLLVLSFPAWGQYSVRDLPNLPDYETHRDSSYDHTGANHDYISVQPGQTVTIFDEDGPGEIRHIWTTIPPWSEAYAHQKVVIRAYWDGETDPSVESPLGNFFGIAFGTGTFPVFQSALISVLPAQALNSYFPMPFRKHGKITITNEGHKEISDYYWNIDWVKSDVSAKAGYFHAQYHQCTPCKGWYFGDIYGNDFDEARKDPRWHNINGEDNYVVLDAKGEGVFVGMMFSVFNNQWGAWNEGDDMIWIDGEKRINGTGGEDYFNSAWGFGNLYQTPEVGLVEFSGEQPGSRSTMYRWHLEAPMRFHKSIKVTMEDGQANLRSDNIFSVAYWYQMEPHTPFPPLPPVEKRIPKIYSTGGAGQDPNMK